MKKFLVAAHGRLAEGLQSTLDLFTGGAFDFTYICAHVEGERPLKEQIQDFLKNVTPEDEVVIFTDLYGGSVNQQITLATKGMNNVFIVAGMNVPVILDIALETESYTRELINQKVINAREVLQQVEVTPEITPTVPAKTAAQPKVNYGGDKVKAIRVDERLIHGQIAMVWSKELKLDGIVVANTETANNPTQQMALKMAVPSGIKVIIKDLDGAAKVLNDPRSKGMNLLAIVRTVQDAVAIAEKVSDFDLVNLGNVGKMVEGDKKILAPTVRLISSEFDALKQLVEIYPETNLQMVPSEKKVLAKEFI